MALTEAHPGSPSSVYNSRHSVRRRGRTHGSSEESVNVVSSRAAPMGGLDPASISAMAMYGCEGNDDDPQRQQQVDVTPPVPQDPLIQQLRCLHLVRQRLKESYWEHRDQLKAVQRYIDYEIN
jgi:hypothetical protein